MYITLTEIASSRVSNRWPQGCPTDSPRAEWGPSVHLCGPQKYNK